MQKALNYAFPLTIEMVGVLLIVIGVAVEIASGADIGHILITIGSLTVAVGSIIWAKILRHRK